MIYRFYEWLLKLPYFHGKNQLENIIRTTYFSPVITAVPAGFKMRLDPCEWLQVEILKNGTLEPLTIALYRRILKPGDVYIDVGAHVGFHTLVARRFIGEKGTVIAIEPQPYNCENILYNWGINGFTNNYLYAAAAGERNGFVDIHNQCSNDRSQLSLFRPNVNDTSLTVRVPMLRLDTIIPERGIGPIKLIKIDVEGLESEVIKGLGNCIDAVENIILEVLDPPQSLSEKSAGLLEFLRHAGYEFNTVTGDKWKAPSLIDEGNLWATRNG